MTLKLILTLFLFIFIGYSSQAKIKRYNGNFMPTGKSTNTADSTNNKWSMLPKSLQKKAKLLPDSSKNECGISYPIVDKIVGGFNAIPGEYPWMALLGYSIHNDTIINCGGSLINKRYVLTAAHCFPGELANSNQKSKTYFVRFGEWDTSSDKDCIEYICSEDVVDIEVERIIKHPQYGVEHSSIYENDIALLRMEKDVPFSDYIIPICLSPNKRPDFDTTYSIAGWGVSIVSDKVDNISSYKLTPILQNSDIKLYDFEECKTMASYVDRFITKKQFCAGGGSSNTCYGDSGGPFQVFDENYFLLGITSFTISNCGKADSPNVYIDVASYIPWILRTIEE